jgi:serine/threonine-protein kinase
VSSAPGAGRYRLDLEGVTLLGQYEVGRKIAEGGMGAVHLATDTRLGIPVVVKVPHVRYLGEEGFAARFAREVDELIRLRHGNVVRILARGTHEDVPFYVLEYLEGGSLARRLAGSPGGRQSATEVLAWLAPIARALEHLHARGVIHRDLKPANILFDGHGDAYLSDFGIVKLLEGETGSLTGTGAAIGSPSYMAPEQALGRTVTPATDEYALAATVYEALGGRPPFDTGTPMEILVRKGSQDPEPLDACAPDLGPELVACVMRGLAREPGARHGGCGAFATAFREAVHREGTREAGAAAEAPARGTAPAPARRRRPSGRWIPGLALAAVLAAAVAFALHAGAGREGGGERAARSPVSRDAAPPPAAPASPARARVSAAQEREAKRLGVPVAFANPLGMRFVLIPGGTFPMGSPADEKDRDDDETLHPVTLTRAYYLQTTEVTNAQYRRFDPQHRSGAYEGHDLDGADQPVVGVSWEDARGYVAWLDGQDAGHAYRLPSEAEWERAARAGTTTRFFWGADEARLPQYANGAGTEDGHAVTAPAGSYPPNAWGLHDVLGNAWEWVRDRYGTYPSGPVTDPRGPPTGDVHVLRGGSWRFDLDYLRVAFRYRPAPDDPADSFGFRVLASVAR